MLNPNFVLVGAFISSLGALSYLIDTVKGKVKPNRVSFLMWSFAPLIAFAAEIKEGVGLSSVMTFSTGLFPLLIFISSFVNKKAEWKITKFDLVCGAISILGLILWQITKVGNLAILFSIIADGAASLPTIKKAYEHPETESAWPWMTTVVGVLLTLLTLNTWNFANSGFIVYIFIVNVIIYSCIQFKLGKRKVAE